MTSIPHLEHIRADRVAHFRVMHAVAVANSHDQAAALLLDKFIFDPSDFGADFEQFVSRLQDAQRRDPNRRVEVEWSVNEQDRDRAATRGGSVSHPICVCRIDDEVAILSWTTALGASLKPPPRPGPAPAPAPIVREKRGARFDPRTGERIN